MSQGFSDHSFLVFEGSKLGKSGSTIHTANYLESLQFAPAEQNDKDEKGIKGLNFRRISLS
jgi:hypothetical protein